ncbi:MAG: aminodeoxychorismate/anthranilate synthase component II [Candidatus Woesearchaeota archaeon]|nr:aminodeoxychorismate/anthranilate synthase component II [Candidatus Woesearchaeota archaeon]HJO01532.1 aminodeoxychorismate/anthranilate synthase component II [Candidatus Woesearchaeota archaeon]
MRVLFIDNPGFTYNLVDEFEKRDCEIVVYRNDVDMKAIDNAIKSFKPKLIVISGYGNVKDAGNSVDVIQAYQGQIPIFGIGFGCECIIEAFEGKVDRSPVINHGNVTRISHDDKTIFKKLDNPFAAGVYNSLSASDVPYDLEVSARNGNDIVMGIRHKECFVEGIQFDPGSLLTADGSLIIENLLNEIGKK